MTKTIKVSLSRAHKLVERVTREVNETTSTIAKMVAPITISVPSEASQVQVVLLKIEEHSKTREALYSVLEVIREKVAAKNAQVGIPQLLAKKAILQQRKTGIGELISASQQNNQASYGRASISVLSNDPAILNEYFDRMKEAEVLNPVRVNVLTDSMIENFQKELKEVQAQADTVSDDINDLNAKHRISFEISDEIAALLGL